MGKFEINQNDLNNVSGGNATFAFKLVEVGHEYGNAYNSFESAKVKKIELFDSSANIVFDRYITVPDTNPVIQRGQRMMYEDFIQQFPNDLIEKLL